MRVCIPIVRNLRILELAAGISAAFASKEQLQALARQTTGDKRETVPSTRDMSPEDRQFLGGENNG